MTPAFHDIESPTPDVIRRQIDAAHRLRARTVRNQIAWAVRFTRLCLAEVRTRRTIDNAGFERIVRMAGAPQ
jgi:hypothetical protein